MKRRQNLVAIFLIICCTSCISSDDIESIKFNNIENISLDEDKVRQGYVLHADIILENKRKIDFKLTDFNLKLYWKDEVINVIYDGGDEEVKFGQERVSIPIKSEISKSLIQKNLLAVTFSTLLGQKNVIKAKGYIVAKKMIFNKVIAIDNEFKIGL